MSALYSVRDVTVSRGRRRLLDAVTLDVVGGEMLAVMGENGAGKSTLLHVLAGDVTPDAGRVAFADRPLSRWSALDQARRRAVLPQRHALDFAFTALEVVLLGRSPHDHGAPGATDRAIARAALERFDALHLADRAFPSLSGGERARVMLARVVAQITTDDDGPRALLVDEPSAALDIAHQHAAFALLRSLAHDDGVAVFVVVHDPNLAARYADRVALLRQGRLVACGGVDDTLTPEHLQETFNVVMVRLDDAASGASALVVGS